MKTEARLADLGIDLPTPAAAVAAYEPWVRTRHQIITSGQLPWDGDRLAYTGKVGAELSTEEGYAAARLCAINAIAQLKAAVGDLDRIRRIVRLEGNVHAALGFRGHPQVLDGASDLFNEVFGERGRHTRTALGINEMPLNAPVQLSVYAEVQEEPATVTEFAHFTLATRNVRRSAEFFGRTLDWRPIPRPGKLETGAAWLRIAPGQEVHLLEVKDFEPSPFEREFGRHIAITYPLSGFEALKKRLVQFGAELIATERETPFERFFFSKNVLSCKTFESYPARPSKNGETRT